MEAVAEHINEMQKIYEEYGAIFDELAKMFKDLYPLKKVLYIQVSGVARLDSVINKGEQEQILLNEVGLNHDNYWKKGCL